VLGGEGGGAAPEARRRPRRRCSDGPPPLRALRRQNGRRVAGAPLASRQRGPAACRLGSYAAHPACGPVSWGGPALRALRPGGRRPRGGRPLYPPRGPCGGAPGVAELEGFEIGAAALLDARANPIERWRGRGTTRGGGHPRPARPGGRAALAEARGRAWGRRGGRSGRGVGCAGPAAEQRPRGPGDVGVTGSRQAPSFAASLGSPGAQLCKRCRARASCLAHWQARCEVLGPGGCAEREISLARTRTQAISAVMQCAAFSQHVQVRRGAWGQCRLPPACPARTWTVYSLSPSSM
jgi:hypothetical protein